MWPSSGLKLASPDVGNGKKLQMFSFAPLLTYSIYKLRLYEDLKTNGCA
jgi:hypothetical protein